MLAETLMRLHVYADDYRAALHEDQSSHGGALIPETPPHAGPRLTCLHCGHAHTWSWIPRVIKGGRE